MADTITEFLNSTGFTYSNLQTGVTVVSNTASETAVIKDVKVNNASNREVIFTVGPTTVATAASTVRLTGSELVGASTSMVAKNNSIALGNVFRNVTYPRLNTPTSLSSTAVSLDTIFSTDNLANPKQTRMAQGTAVTGAAPSVFPDFTCFNSAGDFFYATMRNVRIGATTTGDDTTSNGPGSNNTNMIYKRVGGVSGTESAVVTLPNGFWNNGTTSSYAANASAQSLFFDIETDTIVGFYFPSAFAASSTRQNGYLMAYNTLTGVSRTQMTAITSTDATFRSHSITSCDDFIFLNLNSIIYVYRLSTFALIGSYSTNLYSASTARADNEYGYRGSIAVGKTNAGEYVVIYHNEAITAALVDPNTSSGNPFKALNFGSNLDYGLPTPVVTSLSATALGFADSASGTTYCTGYLSALPSDIGSSVNVGFSGRWSRFKQSRNLLAMVGSFQNLSLTRIKVLDVNSLSAFTLTTRSSLPNVTTNVAYSVDATLAQLDYGTVDIRATGVKTT